MSLVTLQRYLRRTEDKEALVCRRVIALLLEGIRLYSVEGEPCDMVQFRADLERINTSMGGEASAETLLVSAGAAVQALQTCNQRTTAFLRRQSTELRKMISMLTETIVSIGSGNETLLGSLRDIEKKVETAAMLEDIQTVKLRLGECLQTVREEAMRQRAWSEATMHSLRRNLEEAQSATTSGVGYGLDPATGLSGRDAAERALYEALKTPGRKYIAAFVISRLQAINARFGYAVGDEVMRTCSEHFQKHLSTADHLFRWHGPTLLAILERQEPIEKVRTDIKLITEARIERTFNVQGRMVLLPIPVVWSVILVAAPLENTFKQIQTFIASQSSGGIADI